ncbi:MAG TPA: ArsA-related P-loop ATPase [Solirubrobacteraceae bacterium]|jgi:anion-transporting  ArsA/GET3 family ATPase|nr:ArsA-related P-loop ATPase [Solirubrobacteraceae bacterium]
MRTPSVLARRLVVVTGKGGVGKTTIAAALGLAAAERGLRTIVVELGDQRRLPTLLAGEERRNGRPPQQSDAGEETALAESLWSVTIDPDRALLEWLQALGGRVPGRVLAHSGTFQYFAAAAPGAKELVSMVKIWELTRDGERWRRRAGRYDLVVLDAPATGHALGLLHSPRTFGAIARMGPIFGQAERVRELLEDAAQTGYVAVTQATEMAVGETLELREGLRSQLDAELDATIVNATLPQRFAGSELARIAQLDGGETVKRSAMLTARTVHERARVQHNQIARLRRHGVAVQTVPFVFAPALDLDAIRRIGRRLAERV